MKPTLIVKLQFFLISLIKTWMICRLRKPYASNLLARYGPQPPVES